MAPEPICPLCGGKGALPRFPGARLPVHRCRCGMQFLHPQPTDGELKEIYRSDYYRGLGIAAESGQGPEAMKKETFRRQFRLLAGGREPGTVLDVGCATGFFLEVAAEAGWEPYGVELSSFAASVARECFGERVVNGTLEEAGYPDAFFDAVTLFDLIEHVRDPRGFLAEVRRVLRPEGRLLLVTPDLSSLSARLMGRRWSHYHREHLHYFSQATLARLLAETGFTVELRRSAPKTLNLAYIFRQLRRHPGTLVPRLAALGDLVLPALPGGVNFRLHCGAMLVVTRR